jgi:hypothetical protein
MEDANPAAERFEGLARPWVKPGSSRPMSRRGASLIAVRLTLITWRMQEKVTRLNRARIEGGRVSRSIGAILPRKNRPFGGTEHHGCRVATARPGVKVALAVLGACATLTPGLDVVEQAVTWGSLAAPPKLASPDV